MKKNKNDISRKEAIKQLGAVAAGLSIMPLLPGNTAFFRSIGELNASKDLSPLFPFSMSHEALNNVTNFKHLLEAPAGKNGFVSVLNGRFADNAGQVRLNGTNLTGSANFPSHDDAELLGDRLAGLGINCVRLHYMDADYGNFLQKQEQGIIAHDSKTQRNLNPQQLDRLDYLIAGFKKRGIYVDMNLHVARWWDDRDGFPYQDQRPSFDKGLDNFEPRMIELQKEYARKLLTHVNPYTNLPYTDEPAVAVIEINNENSLFSQYFAGTIDKLPDRYATEFRKQWNRWLIKKYKSTAAVKKAWQPKPLALSDNKSDMGDGLVQILSDNIKIEDYSVPTVKLKSAVSPKVKEDFYQFITDTEHAYWIGMYDFLKKDLKVKSLVSGTQITHYGTPFIQAELDYVDNHAYWCHPSPVNPNWQIVNKPMVNSMVMVYAMASQRVLNKPYTVSEYNHPFPNQYGAEGLPIMKAYGSLQGWDGIFEYTFHHRNNFDPSFNSYFFSISDRTEVLAHFRACSAIFLRKDVQEGKSASVGALDYEKYFKHLTGTNRVGAGIEICGLDINHTLVHKTAVDLSGKYNNGNEKLNNDVKGKKILVSDTGELTWNVEEPDAGYLIVNTANTKLFTGFPKDREILLGDIVLTVGKTRLDWTTISLVSHNGNGFGENGDSANILLAATGLTKNNGMTIVNEPGDKIRLTDWGSAPVYAEGIPATLTFPVSAKRIKCYALDTKGNRQEQVPVADIENDKAQIIIKPEYKTVWYEIEIS